VAKYKVPKLDSSTFKGWAFVLVAGVALAFLAMIDRGGLDEVVGANGSTGCQLEVTGDEVNVRGGPSMQAPVVDTLTRGDRVDGTTVVTDGFRELENNRWVDNRFLTPLPGTNCS
jgi:hypothetical protein